MRAGGIFHAIEEAAMSDRMTAVGVVEREDRRYLRARTLAYGVMRSLEPFIADEVQRPALTALLDLFAREGVEVLTDYTRAEIGLPPRDQKGWTIEEIIALERVRLELMLKPIPQFLVNDGTITRA
jgi:hypothetical protein